MEDEEDKVATALLAIAYPVSWVYHPDAGHAGAWYGEAERACYKIYCPGLPLYVDTWCYHRCWLININPSNCNMTIAVAVHSFEEAKALCLRHARTGDHADIDATHQATNAESSNYTVLKLEASKQLEEARGTTKIKRLKWRNNGPERNFGAESVRGTYTGTFDHDRRWIVKFTEREKDTEEHCFLTREFAQRACDLHARTGTWHGTLPVPGSENSFMTTLPPKP